MRWLLSALLLACSDDSAPDETPQAEAPVEAEEESPETPEAPEAPEAPPADECVHVVFDPEPPLRIRAEHGGRGEALGTLANGTPIRVLETRGGWARIERGWVYRRNIYDTCASPPAVPVLPLGETSFALVEAWRDASAESAASLPTAPMEQAAMRMSRTALRATDPIDVTLITKRGACVRRVRERTTLIGRCPEYATQTEALVVQSCPELIGDDADHLTTPLMVAVFGAHPAAVLEDWPREEVEATDAILRQVSRGPDDETSSHVRFEGGRWSWFYSAEEHWIFRDGRLVGEVDMTANEPMRVVERGAFLVGVGRAGFHGYGFYMFPREPLPNQTRELGFAAFTCGAF